MMMLVLLCDKHAGDDAYVLARAAPRIVHKDILNASTKFSSTFPVNCQSEAVPLFLQTLVAMVLTLLEDVVCQHERPVEGLAPCLHEEVDTLYDASCRRCSQAVQHCFGTYS